MHFPKSHRDDDGMFATSRIWLSSIAYNTNLVKAADAPASFADLVDPKWAGKMVKGHPGYSGTIMTATFQLVRELGWEYLEKLSAQRVMQVQSSTDPPKKLALGERAVMADGNDYNVVLLKEAGQPVEPIYPAEGHADNLGPHRDIDGAASERRTAVLRLAAYAANPAVLYRLHGATFATPTGAGEGRAQEDFRSS